MGAAPRSSPQAQPLIDATDPTLTLTPGNLPLQSVGKPFTDPVFGNTLARISNISEGGGFETQIYSQLQAFSSDNTYLLLDGSNGFVVRRVDDFSRVTGLDTAGWNDPRWHPALSHVVVHFDSNEDTLVRLQYTDVDELTTTTVFTFPAQYERIRVNQSFDELSEDGHWLAGMVSRNDGGQVIFALDLQNRTLGALLSLSDLYAGPCQPDPIWGEVEPDWVGISPLGRYLVVQWQRDGISRCSGLETFNLQTGTFVGRVYDGHQHGDLGVKADGVTEFFMTFELYHPSGNLSIGMRELPGTSTASPPSYLQVMDWFGEHISCRGPYGVCLVSTAADPTDGWSALEGEVFLQFTDGSILRLAHHRSSSCGYWVQPRASISRDGRYVVFASDWRYETGTGSCGSGSDLGRGDPYLIDLMVDNEEKKFYLAHLGNGQGSISDIVLTNPSAINTASGIVNFSDDNGLPLPVGIAAAGGDGARLDAVALASQVTSSVDFSIPPLGALTISTDGQGPVISGAAVVTSDNPLGGVIRFSIPNIGIAGVRASQPLSAFIIPVRRKAGGINTGVAMYNTESTPVQITLHLHQTPGQITPAGFETLQDGEPVATTNIDDFPAGGHVAKFINELFPDTDTDNFEGTLVVQVTDGKVAATALELGTQPGEFTTLPVTPLRD